ncbi:MAG: hydrogenase maturation protease [Polyangiaceae bacterium]
MAARVIALGQPAQGDDGVGPRVLEQLASAPPAGVELVHAGDASRLVELLPGAELVVLVDAALGLEPAGTVREVEEAELGAGKIRPLSSHGLGVRDAIELARALADGPLPRIRIVAVGIEAPLAPGHGLSPAVRAAVPVAARAVLRALGSEVE